MYYLFYIILYNIYIKTLGSSLLSSSTKVFLDEFFHVAIER